MTVLEARIQVETQNTTVETLLYVYLTDNVSSFILQNYALALNFLVPFFFWLLKGRVRT